MQHDMSEEYEVTSRRPKRGDKVASYCDEQLVGKIVGHSKDGKAIVLTHGKRVSCDLESLMKVKDGGHGGHRRKRTAEAYAN